MGIWYQLRFLQTRGYNFLTHHWWVVTHFLGQILISLWPILTFFRFFSKKPKPVMVSKDKGLQLSHSPMVGCHSLFGSNFDFRMTYFDGEHGKMLQSIVKEVCSPILHKEQGKMLHSLVESIFSPSFYKSMQNCCYILGPMASQEASGSARPLS